MSDPYAAALGQRVTCAKTVGESDVYLFAGITGDLAPNHVDEEAMAKTVYGGRIAHGALLVGYMSRASTLIQDKCQDLMATHFPVSLGYDRVRFIKAVLIGDTITVAYEITGADPARSRTTADVKITNQKGELCAVATHIMQWIAR